MDRVQTAAAVDQNLTSVLLYLDPLESVVNLNKRPLMLISKTQVVTEESVFVKV